ncbi:PASTA domain-containing protein [Paenibacillus sp. YN15]|uniref:PASTA domain-containing protein n=1 Tax=Paenibacillus sp. YN15 TaxID=1742774 RepID=UPI000DCE1BCC|nr:PASTA domain-containing protein [Paenibacillus sp. YN15]RAU93475.1 hypothetical protein DQG13_25770 [Paenibacillus sp. YN15]
MQFFAERYQLSEPWSKAADGWLAAARDPKLNREVLLWRTVVLSDVEKEELLRRLGAAARFSHNRFMHILDVSVTGTEVYAVLAKKEGFRLSDRIHTLGWSGRVILEQLKELIPAIREAKRERLPDFAITAENLWLDHAGRLQIIQYWLAAPEKERDVFGFATLLYQLCTDGTAGPASMREFQQAVGRRLDGLPGGGPQEAADWASSAFLPSCTLRRMEEGIAGLLNPRPQVPEAPEQAEVGAMARRSRKKQEEASAKPAKEPVRQYADPVPPPEEDEEEETAASSRLRPWLWFSAIVMLIGFLGVVGIWYVTRPPSAEPPAASAVSGTANSAEASAAAGGSPAKGAAASAKPQAGTASPTPASSPRVSPSPGAPSASKPAAEAGQTEQTTVPALTGKTLEEASQAALKAGLRYEYVLETGEAAKNTVFRQEPAAGTAAVKGDKVKFWVSKGKS